MRTPWGVADRVEGEQLRDGTFALFVSTPSHGGYLVPRETAEAFMEPRYLELGELFTDERQNGYYAFEEDCNWSAVILAFPELLDLLSNGDGKAGRLEMARQTFAWVTERLQRKAVGS